MVSQPHAITAETMLPDLLSRRPELRPILDRHGLHGCGGRLGPHESLGFFAQAHGVDLAQLLDELAQRPESPAAIPADDPPADVADTVYRPYFTAAIALVLTLGASWGAYLLWKIGFTGSFTGVSVLEVNAHGHAQIFGWVGLFVMGFAMQALPRMWHVRLPAPRLAIFSLALMVLGIVVRSLGMVAHPQPWGLPTAMLGGAVQIASVCIFAGAMFLAFARSNERIAPYAAFILTGIAALVVQAFFSNWHTLALMQATTRDQLLWQVATYQAPLRDVQIHGLALLMILGVGMRLFPAMFGLPAIGHRRAWWALGLLVAAVVGEVTLFIAYRWTDNHALAAALMLPWLMLTVGVGLIVAPWRPWRPTPRTDRTGKFIRAAMIWLLVSLVMLLMLPVYQAVSEIPFSHAYYGAIRHAITVGFISLMIVGMSARAVATLRGHDPATLSNLWGPFILINLGCFLRVSLQTLTDWHPAFFWAVGISGMLEVTGLCLWSAHLLALMWWPEPTATPQQPPQRPARIEAHHRVADVLAWHPQALDTLQRFGFTMLSQPTLRKRLAHKVTLQTAAGIAGVDLDRLLTELNNTCPPPTATAPQPAQLT